MPRISTSDNACMMFLVEMLSDRETGCFLFDASRVFAEAFSECTSDFTNAER